MAVFDFKDCVAFSWDATAAVRAVRLRRGADGRLQVQAIAKADQGSFGANLIAVREAIAPLEGEVIIAGGNLPGAVCFDHDFPAMSLADLPQAIGFELPRRIPLPAEELRYSWRALPGDAGGSLRIRILALSLRDWDQFLVELAASGWRIDAMVSPWMAVDPLLGAHAEVAIPGLDEGFVFGRDPDGAGKRVMALGGPMTEFDPPAVLAELGVESSTAPAALRTSVDGDAEHWLSAVLLAAYGLSPAWSRDRAGLLSLPGDLHPVRFQLQRAAFMVIAGLTILFALALVGRLALEARREFNALAKERQETLRQVQEFEVRNRAMEPVDAVICELGQVDPGIAEMLACFQQLTVRIPETMSLIQFNSRGNIVELNLRLAGDGDEKLAELESGGRFVISHRQTRRNTDGTNNVFLRLTDQSSGLRGKERDVETTEK